MTHKKLFILSFLLTSILTLDASENIVDHLTFKVISSLNTLPSVEVQQVYKDRDGLMWMATRSGLCSYDGYQLKTYRTSIYSPNVFVSNNIKCLIEDYSHHLWIGTDNGLYTYNKRTGRVVRMNLPGSGVISTFFVGHDKTVWIGTDSGLFSYDNHTGYFKSYNNKVNSHFPKFFQVKSITEDKNGNLYVGTWDSGLILLNVKKSRAEVFPKFNPRNSAHTMFIDRYGRLWVGTWRGGLYCIQNPSAVRHAHIKAYRYDVNNPNSITDDIIYSITSDPMTNTLWVGTRSGLSILPLGDIDGSFINYTMRSAQHYLPHDEVNSIITDGNGQLWLATIGGGVLHTSTLHSLFKNYSVGENMPASTVRSMYVADEDNIWLGIGSYGLAKYNRHTDVTLSYTVMPEFKSQKEFPTVYGIVRQANGDMWIATYGAGVIVYRAGLPVRYITEKNTKILASDNTLSILKSSKGITWIGQREGISVAFNERWGYVLKNNYIVDRIAEDEKGSIWLATENKGIVHITGDVRHPYTLRFHLYCPGNGRFPVNDAVSVLCDSRKIVWAATKSGGLLMLDKKHDKFVAVNRQFHIPDDNINSIIEDNIGNLWLGANYGIVKLTLGKDLERPVVKIYSEANGIADNYCMMNSVAKYGDEIFIGNHKGFFSFKPIFKLKEKNIRGTVTITDMRIYNKSYFELDSVTQKRVSNCTPSFTREITIPSNMNNFTLEFSSLIYDHAEQCKYAYQLKGFDKKMVYTDANRRYAYYNNLPSGTYYFHLRATNTSGEWYDMPYVIKVNVLPPFYATWWAYIIYIIIIATIAYFIYSIAQNRARMKILQSRIQSLLEANAKIKDSDEDLKDKIVVEMKDLDYSDSDAEFLHRAMNIVNTHLDDSDFDQLTFASEMGVSKSTLYNKLRLLAGMNTTSFINSIRMKQAVHFLEQYPNIRVSELAYRVGYNDPKYFSTSFKKYYGILVKEYVETKIKHQ